MGEKWSRGQKIWAVVGGSSIFVVALLVLITFIAPTGCGCTEEYSEGHATVVGDNYKIQAISMNQISILNLRFQLLDEYGGPKVDSEDEAIYGEVSEIAVQPYFSNQSFYETKDDTMPLNETANDQFYYYVVFQDVDANGYVNAGDVFLVKGRSNSGNAGEGDIFRLKNKATGKTIWEVEFPEA